MQPITYPSRSLARVTLVGSIEPITGSDPSTSKLAQKLLESRERFGDNKARRPSLPLEPGSQIRTATRPTQVSSQMFRLKVESCHLTRGLVTKQGSSTEVVTASEYHAAQASRVT